MKTIIFLFGLGLVLLSLSSCKTNNQSTSQNSMTIVEKYWKLIEINGKPFFPENQKREPHLILKETDNRISGNAGCNSFFGNYEMPGDGRIRFSKIGATKMACNNMEVEGQFFKAMEMADNYTMKADTLSLNKAKMAPLARFVLVNVK